LTIKQSKLIAFNKPYGVISQFSPDVNHPSLAEFISDKEVYPAGRLDTDSEGLLLLTNDGLLQAKLSSPKFAKRKTYIVQVDGIATQWHIDQLESGVNIGDNYITKPAQAKLIEEPLWLWSRTPPVRYRKNIPTSWIELTITEGKNRQVRKMTSKLGLPTLRLIRVAIGEYNLLQLGLQPGTVCTIIVNNSQS